MVQMANMVDSCAQRGLFGVVEQSILAQSRVNGLLACSTKIGFRSRPTEARSSSQKPPPPPQKMDYLQPNDGK